MHKNNLNFFRFPKTLQFSQYLSSLCVCTQLHAGAGSPLDALDALSNTLEDIAPAPQPTPPPTKDIVKVARSHLGNSLVPQRTF